MTRPLHGAEKVLARGLWDCLLIAGADISDYAEETRTEAGRDAGFAQWARMRTFRDMAGETLEAVTMLREEADGA